tara:strand:+ start:582 stop:791 length:210 start_codon:yes stop_codon:yes gene_type:complete
MTLPIWFIDNIFKQNQKSVVGTSITIESPNKVAWVMGGENTPVDIEEDVTVTVDDGCLFMIVDPPADYT